MKLNQPFLLILLIGLCFTNIHESNALIESERIEEYNRRGHQWPPRQEDYTPPTPGWKEINERRFTQLEGIEATGESYDGYMVTTHSALICKNFTENGWGLTRAPQYIVDLLLESLHTGLEEQKKNPTYESRTGVIETENRPYFIEQYELNNHVMQELLPLHEAWSGVSLIPNNAYGLRVYREGSNLNMHVDKSNTHIISSILHVDHDKDMESWPIIIEDFQGNTNEVNLESGDMLFYESSKCMHGRPRRMKEGWYSSLFIHYYPKDWNAESINLDTHYRIPSIWNQKRAEDGVDELRVVESSLKESGCEHDWCAMKDTVKWSGPGPGYGKVLSSGNVIRELEGIPTEENYIPSDRNEL